jgi:hypothetical protein
MGLIKKIKSFFKQEKKEETIEDIEKEIKQTNTQKWLFLIMGGSGFIGLAFGITQISKQPPTFLFETPMSAYLLLMLTPFLCALYLFLFIRSETDIILINQLKILREIKKQKGEQK